MICMVFMLNICCVLCWDIFCYSNVIYFDFSYEWYKQIMALWRNIMAEHLDEQSLKSFALPAGHYGGTLWIGTIEWPNSMTDTLRRNMNDGTLWRNIEFSLWFLGQSIPYDFHDLNMVFMNWRIFRVICWDNFVIIMLRFSRAFCF